MIWRNGEWYKRDPPELFYRARSNILVDIPMIKQEGKFKWLEEGEGSPIILLHGLMGGVDNFGDMVSHISKENKVYGLDLRLFEGSLLKVSVKNLSDYLFDFMCKICICHLKNISLISCRRPACTSPITY